MISVDPNYVMGLHTLALSEFGLGNLEESLKLANQGLSKFPTYSQYMVAKMMALNRLGRLAEAELIRDALFKRHTRNGFSSFNDVSACGILCREYG